MHKIQQTTKFQLLDATHNYNKKFTHPLLSTKAFKKRKYSPIRLVDLYVYARMQAQW